MAGANRRRHSRLAARPSGPLDRLRGLVPACGLELAASSPEQRALAGALPLPEAATRRNRTAPAAPSRSRHRWRVPHHARSLATNRKDARPGSHQPWRFFLHVLDACANDCPPHLRWMPIAGRRLDRKRHCLRPGQTESRLFARNDLARRRADRAAFRRDAPSSKMETK